MRIWSIGHGARPLDEFLALLREADIAHLADVRAFPGSRRHPRFAGEALTVALAEVGVSYLHLPGLGGRRDGRADSPHRALQVAGFRAYADHMSSEEFARDYERLRALGRVAATAFMCAETLWWRCHRRMVADQLTVDGEAVTHLLAPGRSESHALWDAARIHDGHLAYDAGTLGLPA